MANKSGGASKVAQSNSYKTSKRWERNRKNRLTKLLMENPNNKQLETALDNIRWRRGTPKTEFWSKTRIDTAMRFKRFVGKFHTEIFNNNDKVSGPALMMPGKYSKMRYPSVNEKVMFQLGTRAHDSMGRTVWGS